MVPEHHKGQNVYGAHIGRYEATESIIKNKVVLDVASGSGYGSQLMAQNAKQVFGVDVSQNAIEYAQKYYPAQNLTYKLGNGKEIPLDDNSVDVVVSFETIEHIKDYKLFLSEIKRVLKPGGILLLSTPNNKEYPKGNHFHFYEFGHKELVTLLNKYFKNVHQYFQTYWLYSNILSRESLNKEWDSRIKTKKTIGLEPEKCIYFFMVCSDARITDLIESAGVIGEHYSPMKVHRVSKQRQDDIQKLNQSITTLQSKLTASQAELSLMRSSRAWKAAKRLGKVKRLTKLNRSKSTKL